MTDALVEKVARAIIACRHAEDNTPPDDVPTTEYDRDMARAAIAAMDDGCNEAATAIAALVEERDRLREALKPFAEEVGRFGRGNSELKVSIRAINQKAISNFDLSVAHFEAARAALAQEPRQ